jgi:hypothetical protein
MTLLQPAAAAFSTGIRYFQVLDPPPLTSDTFDDCNLDPTIWTVYNPDPQNVHGSKIDGNHNEGYININIPGG